MGKYTTEISVNSLNFPMKNSPCHYLLNYKLFNSKLLLKRALELRIQSWIILFQNCAIWKGVRNVYYVWISINSIPEISFIESAKNIESAKVLKYNGQFQPRPRVSDWSTTRVEKHGGLQVEHVEWHVTILNMLPGHANEQRVTRTNVKHCVNDDAKCIG